MADFTSLAELVEKLKNEKNFDRQEDILQDLIYESQCHIRKILETRKSCWIAIYDSDPYSDYPAVYEYTLLGNCTKAEALERFNKKYDTSYDGTEEPYFDEFKLIEVDEDVYDSKWVPLRDYSKALRALEYQRNCPKEVVFTLRDLVTSLRNELGVNRKNDYMCD